MSAAVTNSIRVEVTSKHSPEHSQPLQDEWVFTYTVRITNEGTETAQLISRHWIITDSLGNTKEVRGAGVVGKQPVLAPGESFQYSSWSSIGTPMGAMHGVYHMVGPGGARFDIEIAAFALEAWTHVPTVH